MRSAITSVAWVGAALVALPLAACQQPEYAYAPPNEPTGGENTYQQPQQPQQQPPATPPEVVSINDRFVQPLPDRCEYTSTVRGTVRQMPVSADTQNMQGDFALFEPNLRVNAEVNCPTVESQHISAHTLNGQQLTRKELESALNERASVVTVDHDRVCTIEPKYVLDPSGGLHAEGAREMCAVGAASGAQHQNAPEWNQGDYDQNAPVSPDTNVTH